MQTVMGPPRSRSQRWCSQPLTPLIEGPDLNTQIQTNKKESKWEIIRGWIKFQRDKVGDSSATHLSPSFYKNAMEKKPDLKLVLSVLGCPLAPISLIANDPDLKLPFTGTPHKNPCANYILQQYLAATGCLKLEKSIKSLYAAGTVKMGCWEIEMDKKTNKNKRDSDTGCFVVWQMSPSMWTVEVAAGGNKVVAGSNGKVTWRHAAWLGTHAAKGPQRPLRRIIQGLDPRSTANIFSESLCLGEKRIGEDDCFVLKVAADRETIAERSDGTAETIRHVLYGYFNQKTGLLNYIEDSHLVLVHSAGNDAMYWETTMASVIEDYRDIDGVLVAHRGRSIATILRFGETSENRNSTRMEEAWKLDDVVFNVPGLSVDSFIPPSDLFTAVANPSSSS